MSTVQNIINSVLSDGARAGKFDVDIVFNNTALFPDSSAVNVLAKATTMPGKTHDKIDFKFKGRNIPLKGQTKYEQTWECTFYLTEDHRLKNAFEIWIEALDEKHNYIQDTRMVPGLEYTQMLQNNKGALLYSTTAKIYQLNYDGNRNTACYELFNLFPVEITAVQYSAESVGQIQEFTVRFSYSYHKLEVFKDSETGAFIDSLIDKGVSSVQGAAVKLATGINNGLSNLANDAIGGAKAGLANLTNSISDYSTALDEKKQFVSSAADQVSSIFSIEV